MTIRIEAKDLRDARHQLGLSLPNCPIKIFWRNTDVYSDFGRIHEPGCIVDAVGIPGEEVQRSFANSWDAVRHIQKLLKLHDKAVREERAKRNKELRKSAGKTKT